MTSVTWLGAPACGDDGTGWRAEWQELECAVLDLVNQRRAAGATCGGRGFRPAGPLSRRQEITNSARAHAEDMAKRNYFDHFTPEGASPFDRMRAAGYAAATMGENISAGQQTAPKVVEDWMNSPHHCENIMNPAFTELGVGYYREQAGDKYHHYWVQNFGSGAPAAVPASPPARRAPLLRSPPKRTRPQPSEFPPPAAQEPTARATQQSSSSAGLFILGGAIAAVAALVFFA
jgi:uncharacterized protein YkwD